MAQYLSPGVYVEEIPSAVKPIAGVGTSTAGFIGIYSGSVGIPIQNNDYDPTHPTTPEKDNIAGAGGGVNLPYEITYFNPSDDDLARIEDPANKADEEAAAAEATAEQAIADARTAEKNRAGAPEDKRAADVARNAAMTAAKAKANARNLRMKANHLLDLALAARMTRPGDDELKQLEDAAAKEAPGTPRARELHDKAARARITQAQYGHAVEPGRAKLCTSFHDFERFFGTFSINPDHNRLAHGVYGFFNNGGNRCFVIHFDNEADAMNLRAFDSIDEIAIVAAPGVLSEAVQQAIVDHCENLGDRFAIIDGKNIDCGNRPGGR